MLQISWDVRYRNRVNRLKRLIELDAPKPIIDKECRMVRDAIHGGRRRVWRADFKYWVRDRWWDFKYLIKNNA